MLTVLVGVLGRDTHQMQVPSGTTLKWLTESLGLSTLEGLTVRVNKEAVSLSRRLRENDIIAVVPSAIGGAAGRFEHLDLDRYRREMSPSDYQFFTRFAGAEALGVKDHDIEV